MVITRLISLIFRASEFICSVVVLGIIGWFLSRNHRFGFWPRGRMIYTEVIAALSTVFALVWMIPTTHHMLHYPLDLILSLAWFAAFGALIQWGNNNGCGGGFFRGIIVGGDCGTWRAAEAFSFLAACFFLASMILGIYVYHKEGRDDRGTRVHDEHNGVGNAAAGAPAGTSGRRGRRGLFGHKSEV